MHSNLDIFAIVVEQESLNKASRILHLSQPALSRKMMHLEQELGVALFERKGKRLKLTRAGRICYEYAVRMREITAEFKISLRPFANQSIPKSLTIGASLTTLQASLPELVSLFAEDYSETDIKVTTGKTHEIVELVRDKKTDLGLIASATDHPELACYPLFDDHLCLLLPPGHPGLQRIKGMSDLNELPMILFSKGTWYRVLMDELFERYGIMPNVKMEIDSFEAILRLGATLGCATLLPASYLDSRLASIGDMIPVELEELQAAKRTTCLILCQDSAIHQALQGFIGKAQEYFREEQM